MKYYKLFTILFMSAISTVSAQNFSREFGKIGVAEIELTEYAADKSAEALVLFDIGKSHFAHSDNGFDIVFERSTRIKIFSEAGIDWADISIEFYQEGGIYEKVYDIEAYTYNYENGELSKTKLDINTIHEEKINNSWNRKKFAMPDVKEGSIIEYRYKIQTQYHFNLQDWEFQWKIPVIYSEYEVKMIPFYEYTWIAQGISKFDFQESHRDNRRRRFNGLEFEDMVHKYIMKNVPAFNDEEYISSINDYIIKIDFQLTKVTHTNGSVFEIMSTWPKIINDLAKHESLGKYAKKSEKSAAKNFDLNTLANKSSTEKLDAILNYVKRNYTWNKRNGIYASKSLNKFIKDKFGNNADINLFTIGLLNAAGIEAYPVIISTRSHGKIKTDYPFRHFFNYVIILSNIDGHLIMSDATEINNSNFRLPPRCINDFGLLINKNEEKWIGLQFKLTSTLQTDISIRIEDSDLNARIQNTASEYYAYFFRKAYGENKKSIGTSLKEKGYNVNDSSISVKNQTNIKAPYILKYTLDNEAEIINNKIYISPFLKETITDNPLKQKSRSYPIDMIYAKQKTLNSTIHIPEGYKVDFLPENYKIANNLFELDYLVTVNDNKVKVSFRYFFKKSVYAAKDYAKLKFYFKEIVKRGNAKIVFSKIE